MITIFLLIVGKRGFVLVWSKLHFLISQLCFMVTYGSLGYDTEDDHIEKIFPHTGEHLSHSLFH